MTVDAIVCGLATGGQCCLIEILQPGGETGEDELGFG